jgi:diguanylate cyclase (GGDEF)-like protein
MMLAHKHHRIFEASDGAEGLEKTRLHRPDLAIADVLMPTMDGFEFVRQLRADPLLAGTRVIFHTATYLESEAWKLARACGVSHVIVSPAAPQDILDTIDAALSIQKPAPLDNFTDEFDREHLRLMTNKLSQKIEELEGVNASLTQEVAQRRRAELAFRESQEKLERLTRLHTVLSGINSAMVRIRDRRELLRETVRTVVEHGKFRMACIVDGNLGPIAWAGTEEEYLFSAKGKSLIRGLGEAAFETGAPVLCNDIRAEPDSQPWRVEALSHGYRSAAALPLVSGGRPTALIEICSADTEFFNGKELQLLKDLAADISFALEHMGNEEKLNYLAYYDELTGVANRSLFSDRLNQLLLEARREKGRVGVVVLELDRFSSVTDTFGRTAGDSIIRQVVERLKDQIENAGSLARISKSSFAVCLPFIKEEADVAHFLERPMVRAFEFPFKIDQEELRISFNAGISLYPSDGTEAETLLRNAEAALSKAASSGDRYLFYTASMNARTAEKLMMEHALSRALQNDEFVLYYQPKIDLKTGRISGFEALIRWQNPTKGLVYPGAFIPVLEESGLIVETGDWILNKAAADYREWISHNLDPPRISVNVSPLQLRQKNFVLTMARAVAKFRNGFPSLDLELTESVLMENIEKNIPKLQAIKEMGVGISIDDFGTGYSSLSYIAKLPVNALKIDRSFIVDLDNNPVSMSIVSAIISLAHSLNLKVIAEGVESEQQCQLLKLMRCDEFQGFLFSPAVPPEQVEKMLQLSPVPDTPCEIQRPNATTQPARGQK